MSPKASGVHLLVDLEQNAELLGDAAASYPAQYVGILLNAWASLRGYLTGEVLGSLGQLIGDADQLYRAHLRTVMLGMGFDPSRIDAAAPRPHA